MARCADTLFALVETDPAAMSNQELRAWLGGLANSDVMRSLIMAEVGAIRAGRAREERTLRNLWYEVIKPALSRAGLLNQTTRGGQAVAWATLLSKYVGELVRDGRTTYEELRIVDGSRQRRVATAVSWTAAAIQLVGAHFPWVIIFTEKDTIWGVLRSLASLYGVSAISGKGQPSAACTENTVKAILESDAYDGQDLVLLSCTDYDPSGYSIARSQAEQLRENLGPGRQVIEQRLGIRPDQLTRQQRAANAYEPKRDGLAEWYAETGGVDGQPLGLELDALSLSQLRSMFAIGIEQHVNLEPRRDDLRAAFVDGLAWELLAPQLEARRGAMLAAVRENGLWERIRATAIPPDLFRQAAVLGWDSIDPGRLEVGGEPLFDCAEDVRAAMEAAA